MGECDVVGETVGSAAVELAKKIVEEAGVGEILTSRTVKDLVVGSSCGLKRALSKSFPDLKANYFYF